MKFTKIALALATLAMAQNAAAFDVYVSGASALRDTMPRLMNKFCQTNSVATPRTLTQVGADKDLAAYSCTFHTVATANAAATPFNATAELGALVGKQVTVYHSVKPGTTATLNNLVGGSITGIIPLINGSTNGLIKFAVLGGTANGTDTTFAGAAKFNTPNSVAVEPQLGFTDVEPKLFSAAFGNVPTDSTATSAGWVIPTGHSAAELVSEVAFVGSFGVGVSQNGVTAGLTNVSLDQLAAILSGDIASTGQLGLATDLPIRVCRRTPGSGTQATFNALVSHKSCGANKAGNEFVVADAAGNPQVTENATTTNVKSCLTAANTAGTEVAVGILGLENNTNDGTYQLVKVNNVQIFDTTETAANSLDGTADNIREDKIISGEYPLWVESHVVKSGKVALSADQSAFYTLLKDKAGDPVFTKTLPGVVSDATKRTGNIPNLNEGAINFSRAANSCNPAIFQP
ncbi:MAG TPA: substrate-binding domain-containing protein [Methylophilaceae bacterium]|jgi:hypothetical protein